MHLREVSDTNLTEIPLTCYPVAPLESPTIVDHMLIPNSDAIIAPAKHFTHLAILIYVVECGNSVHGLTKEPVLRKAIKVSLGCCDRASHGGIRDLPDVRDREWSQVADNEKTDAGSKNRNRKIR